MSPPASAGLYHRYQSMEAESALQHTDHRQPSQDTSLEPSPTTPQSSATQPPHKKRKPLPGAPVPRALSSTAAALSLPVIDHKRYTTVRVLHLQWANDWRQDLLKAGLDFAKTLREIYGFDHQLVVIPLVDSHKHLRDAIDSFTKNEDERGVLKIIYYAGNSYLNGDRSMMLAG